MTAAVEERDRLREEVLDVAEALGEFTLGRLAGYCAADADQILTVLDAHPELFARRSPRHAVDSDARWTCGTPRRRDQQELQTRPSRLARRLNSADYLAGAEDALDQCQDLAPELGRVVADTARDLVRQAAACGTGVPWWKLPAERAHMPCPRTRFHLVEALLALDGVGGAGVGLRELSATCAEALTLDPSQHPWLPSACARFVRACERRLAAPVDGDPGARAVRTGLRRIRPVEQDPLGALRDLRQVVDDVLVLSDLGRQATGRAEVLLYADVRGRQAAAVAEDVIRIVRPRLALDEQEHLLLGSVVVVTAEPEILAVLRTAASSLAAHLGDPSHGVA